MFDIVGPNGIEGLRDNGDNPFPTGAKALDYCLDYQLSRDIDP